jgi:glycosyltransferase involved in cell wall biosynthesis
VVIPAHDAAQTLPAQLDALAGQTYRGDWEVILVDNGSTDRTTEVAEAWSDKLPALRVIKASERQGAAYARNVGALNARGDFLVFCDSDDVVSADWLKRMAKGAERFDLVAGALETVSLNGPLSRAARPYPPMLVTAAESLDPFAVSANVGVWKRALESIGGWNESYLGAASEDRELSKRAQVCGFTLGSVPDAIVHYRLRPGWRSFLRQERDWARANALFYRDYRLAGVARDSIWLAGKTWAWLLLHLPDLVRDGTLRGRWLRIAAKRYGHIAGSIRYRVLYP